MDPAERLAEWSGRELVDVNGARIGSVAGLAYPRKKFGTTWLLVETADAKSLVIPAEQIGASGDRLQLPYPKRYVDGGPTFDPALPFGREEERRLRLHYGLDFGMQGTQCQSCGLCMATRRLDRAR